ncbi:MAG: proteasome assembly chaperone family protein, partial [Thaumarchaeota archaeon]|nr:proteasome assembly chaperone family protein [Nitrososphaerota archaeon]
LAVEHIIQEVNAKLLADIYSPSFPPQVMIRSNGTAELMKNTIHYWKNDGKPDMLLLTGDGQPLTPEAEYTLGIEILELADKFHTKTVFTLAAYITGVFVDKPKVYTTATDEDLLKEFQSKGMIVMDGGSIIGMNGLMVGLAKSMGMRGICLLGETSGYVVDAKASQAILEALLDQINVKIDMKNLEKRAKDTEALIQTIEQQMQKRSMAEQQQTKPSSKDVGYIS